jgi:hypothetical protein
MILDDVQGIVARLECDLLKTTYVFDEYDETVILKSAVEKAVAL